MIVSIKYLFYFYLGLNAILMGLSLLFLIPKIELLTSKIIDFLLPQNHLVLYIIAVDKLIRYVF